MNEIRCPDNVAEEQEEQTIIPDFEIESIARCLLPKIQAYFNSAEGQAAFAAWKKQQNSGDT